MKKELRKLEVKALSKLAYETGVLAPNQSKKEKVDAIATWAAGYNLRWSDLLSRFTWLGGAQ